MNPCYNTIALARHQHEIDRQEAKEHWIAAAVDRLMDDEEWYGNAMESFAESCKYPEMAIDDYAIMLATLQANREYQQHLSALEQARIDGEVGL